MDWSTQAATLMKLFSTFHGCSTLSHNWTISEWQPKLYPFWTVPFSWKSEQKAHWKKSCNINLMPIKWLKFSSIIYELTFCLSGIISLLTFGPCDFKSANGLNNWFSICRKWIITYIDSRTGVEIEAMLSFCCWFYWSIYLWIVGYKKYSLMVRNSISEIKHFFLISDSLMFLVTFCSWA